MTDTRNDAQRHERLQDAAAHDVIEGTAPLSDADVLRLDPAYVAARLALEELAASLALAAPLSSPPAHLKDRLMAHLAKQAASQKEAAPQKDNSPDSPFTRRPDGSFDVMAGVTGVRTSTAPWKQAPVPGIEYKEISYDSERGYSTRLVRFGPGVRYPTHRHGGTEEIFVLEGKVEVNGILLQAGDYCRSEAGTEETGTYTELGALAIVVSSDLDEVTAS
ncbi:MAG: cupin domain-containing protein [Thermoanaerobaculia bacterium]